LDLPAVEQADDAVGLLDHLKIERAHVHISLPKDSVFLESKQEAKASVVVSLRARARLSAQNAAAITYLVASAVDRLSPDAVSVMDTRGNRQGFPLKIVMELSTLREHYTGMSGTARAAGVWDGSQSLFERRR